MDRKGSRRIIGTVGILMMTLAVCCWGCGRRASEDDLVRAKSVVQRALVAGSFEDFLKYFTKERQDRMRDTAIWIRWWQEKLSKNRSAWAVDEARDAGGGVVEVVVQHRRRETSRQYYRLVQEGNSWAIREIESER